MIIKDEVYPKVKADVRMTDDKTLWVKVSKPEFEKVGRVILEDGSIFCKTFYQDAEPKWIPCSERLPEPNVYVLMTTAWGSVTIGERIYPAINNTVYFIHDGTTNAELDDVVAWMPLPSPYRGESE